MADFITNMGGVIDVTTVDRVIRYKSTDNGKRGAILNKGAATVYFGWGTLIAIATDAEGVDKAFIAAGEAIRIPRKCNFFAVKTAAGTAKLIHVED
jgi:hypothetical protein